MLVASLKCLFLTQFLVLGSNAEYYGKDLGRLSELEHGVSGHVYAVDGRTLFIKNFYYDGEGPAAYFIVGNSKAPSNNGAHKLRDEQGNKEPLRKYRGKDITLTLPEGKTLHNFKWFSVWCEEYSSNFGDIKIPRNLDYPKPQKIGSLSGVHYVSSDPIVIVDAQTLLIPNFSYDGEAPDAKFWVGKGDKPSPQGIRVPDENGKELPLRRYDRKTIVLTLPGDLTIFDIGHFGVWCEAFTVDFGHIRIPKITNVPPSLKMLGVSPQKRNQALTSHQPTSEPIKKNKYQIQSIKATTYRPPSRLQSSLVETPNQQQLLNVYDASYQLGGVIPSFVYRRAYPEGFSQNLPSDNSKHIETEQRAQLNQQGQQIGYQQNSQISQVFQQQIPKQQQNQESINQQSLNYYNQLRNQQNYQEQSVPAQSNYYQSQGTEDFGGVIQQSMEINIEDISRNPSISGNVYYKSPEEDQPTLYNLQPYDQTFFRNLQTQPRQ